MTIRIASERVTQARRVRRQRWRFLSGLGSGALLCGLMIVACSNDDGGPPGGQVGGEAGAGAAAESGAGGAGGAGGAHPGGVGVNGGQETGGAHTAGEGGNGASGAGGDGADGGSAGSNDVVGGAAGASGATDGGGGDGGAGGHSNAGPGELTLSMDYVTFGGECTPVINPETFTITNTGGSPLSWSATQTPDNPLIPASFRFTPAGSTLLPGSELSVQVTRFGPPWTQYPTLQLGTITVTSDVVGASPATVQVFDEVVGATFEYYQDIDFGNVPIGSSKLIHVPPTELPYSSSLRSSNDRFEVVGILDHGIGWDVYFSPLVAGKQESTMTIGKGIIGFPICPPNTFKATGTGY